MILDNQGLICAQHRHNHEPHHVYGSSRLLYNTKQELSWVYVIIPKAASSFMKAVSKKGHWYNYQHNEFWDLQTNSPDERWRWLEHKIRRSIVLASPKRYLIILRDIIDRWTSALGQIVDLDDPVMCDFDRLIEEPRQYRDNHIEPQISFVHGLDPECCVWVRADDELQRNIVRWSIHNKMIDQLVLPVPPAGPDNNWTNQTALKSDRTKTFVWGLREFVRQDPVRIQRVLDAYDQDAELLSSVTFFRG